MGKGISWHSWKANLLRIGECVHKSIHLERCGSIFIPNLVSNPPGPACNCNSTHLCRSSTPSWSPYSFFRIESSVMKTVLLLPNLFDGPELKPPKTQCEMSSNDNFPQSSSVHHFVPHGAAHLSRVVLRHVDHHRLGGVGVDLGRGRILQAGWTSAIKFLGFLTIFCSLEFPVLLST